MKKSIVAGWMALSLAMAGVAFAQEETTEGDEQTGAPWNQTTEANETRENETGLGEEPGGPEPGGPEPGGPEPGGPEEAGAPEETPGPGLAIGLAALAVGALVAARRKR